MDISLKSTTTIRYLKLSLLFAIVFVPLFWWNWINDPYREIAEQFLQSSNQLKSKIGIVKSYELRKITTLLRDSGVGNAKEADRIKYRFNVEGGKGDAVVTLVLQFTDLDQVEKIEIHSIEQ